jgi:hypothetical protein
MLTIIFLLSLLSVDDGAGLDPHGGLNAFGGLRIEDAGLRMQD